MLIRRDIIANSQQHHVNKKRGGAEPSKTDSILVIIISMCLFLNIINKNRILIKTVLKIMHRRCAPLIFMAYSRSHQYDYLTESI